MTTCEEVTGLENSLSGGMQGVYSNQRNPINLLGGNGVQRTCVRKNVAKPNPNPNPCLAQSRDTDGDDGPASPDELRVRLGDPPHTHTTTKGPHKNIAHGKKRPRQHACDGGAVV